MPRKRTERSREEKSAEILDIAERLFLERGYDGTTMAAIARAAGVASNVIHWYFPTKDELFVAVMEALQLRDMQWAEKQLASLPAGGNRQARTDILSDFVCRRLDRYSLISTLHERSQHSDVIAGFHERVHQRYAQGLEMALDVSSIPAAERTLIVDALITAIEGLIMHRASKQQARQMMSFLADRLIPAG